MRSTDGASWIGNDSAAWVEKKMKGKKKVEVSKEDVSQRAAKNCSAKKKGKLSPCSYLR